MTAGFEESASRLSWMQFQQVIFCTRKQKFFKQMRDQNDRFGGAPNALRFSICSGG